MINHQQDQLAMRGVMTVKLFPPVKRWVIKNVEKPKPAKKPQTTKRDVKDDIK